MSAVSNLNWEHILDTYCQAFFLWNDLWIICVLWFHMLLARARDGCLMRNQNQTELCALCCAGSLVGNAWSSSVNIIREGGPSSWPSTVNITSSPQPLVQLDWVRCQRQGDSGWSQQTCPAAKFLSLWNVEYLDLILTYIKLEYFVPSTT